jgi:carboxylesterase
MESAAGSKTMKLGCLILHGLTSSLDCVNGLVPYMEKNAIPYRMPVLRGHMTRPEDLVGVTWPDWYADGEAALLDLCREVDKAVVVGLSMGALVAMQLGMEHADKVDSVVVVAGAMKLKNPLAPGKPLAFLQPVIKSLIKYWPMPAVYNDPALAATDTNYRKLATGALMSFLEYGKVIEKRLPELKTPVLVIQSHNDQLVAEDSATCIVERSGATVKRVVWFERSKHEMMRDVEREGVFQTIEAFVLERKKG